MGETTRKNAVEIPFPDEYEKLELLISQGQFELLLPEEERKREIRLIYLMNDAVESFLVFQNAELTGTYLPEFQGELSAVFEKDGNRYVLIVYQGDSVCTLFFGNLILETHLFNYGQTGHFWVKGYEYLRQLEYRIAILWDKRIYLGEEFCTEEELRMAVLAEFPPLNFCCYPSVPDKYLVPSCPWWRVSGEALREMTALAAEAGDKVMLRWLRIYGAFPRKSIARQIARLLHRVEHARVADLISRKLACAAAVYPDRAFGGEKEKRIQRIRQEAESRRNELEESGKNVVMLKEEPFLYAKDSLEYKIHLMIWKTKGRNRQVDVETIR